MPASPQQAATETDAFETLYGGAAGGGKSDWLLGLARTRHQRSLLLRRQFPDLERSLISRSLEFFGEAKLYNGSRHVWHIGKQRIEFGHMQRVGTPSQPGDEEQYASAPYDLIGFDQLEQFPQYAYEFMLSRARTTTPGQRVRVCASANPVGEGVAWIMQRWAPWLDPGHAHPAQPGELRWFKRDAQGAEVETSAEDPDAVSRTYIPARLADNPYLGDDYRRVLNLMPEPMRSALLNGDWEASVSDDAYQVLPRAWVKAAMARWTPQRPDRTPDRVGCDVAHGGEDATVLGPRWGSYLGALEVTPGIQTPDGQSVVALLQPYGKAMINIDATGVGASAYDIGKGAGLNIVGVNFGGRNPQAKDSNGVFGFANSRAEMYWRLREALAPEAADPMALPPDPELLAELTTVHWKMQINGIQLESKDDIKRRLGRSPDKADAVALAVFDGGEGILGYYRDLLHQQVDKDHQLAREQNDMIRKPYG